MFQNLKNASKALLAVGMVAAVLAPAASVFAASVIKIDGSTTVWPITQIATYQTAADLPGVTYDITYTGSGHGQTSITNGFVDIGSSSSSCSAANAMIPNPNSFTSGTYNKTTNAAPYPCTGANAVVDNVIAKDGVSIEVNTARSCLAQITLGQVQGIWEGTITNWNQIGCENHSIDVLARIIGSGTRASFVKLAGVYCTDSSDCASTPISGGKSEQIVVTLPRLGGNAEMEAKIASDQWAIGYVGLAFTDPNVKLLPLDTGNSYGFVAPSVATVLNGHYGLSRDLHMYTKPSPSADVTNFIQWIKNPAGQSIIQQLGFANIATVVPNWDVDASSDKIADVLDLATIGANWQVAAPVVTVTDPGTGDTLHLTQFGWIRSDVNSDGVVDVLDLATVGANWQKSW
jgi:phosphate transport system substrate-binding protein